MASLTNFALWVHFLEVRARDPKNVIELKHHILSIKLIRIAGSHLVNEQQYHSNRYLILAAAA